MSVFTLLVVMSSLLLWFAYPQVLSVLGYMTMQFNSQRVGMAAILVFFIIGGRILLTVRTKRVVAKTHMHKV